MSKFQKKWEASKVILFIMMIAALILTAFTCWACIYFDTTDPLYVTVPAIFAELASATGFYYWKSKNENKVKMVLSCIEEMTEMEGITEEQTRVLESLLGSLD